MDIIYLAIFIDISYQNYEYRFFDLKISSPFIVFMIRIRDINNSKY